jgi:hypothetical protein
MSNYKTGTLHVWKGQSEREKIGISGPETLQTGSI